MVRWDGDTEEDDDDSSEYETEDSLRLLVDNVVKDLDAMDCDIEKLVDDIEYMDRACQRIDTTFKQYSAGVIVIVSAFVVSLCILFGATLHGVYSELSKLADKIVELEKASERKQ
jgi:hypothetical protein